MIKIVRGDITSQTTGAIVNAANKQLIAGSGVFGAIHLVAGPELKIECLMIGGCPTGEARITKAYDLPHTHVIIAVGSRYLDGAQGELETLTRCYQSIYLMGKTRGIDSFSFPTVSTVIYQYPVNEATKIDFARTLAVLEE